MARIDPVEEKVEKKGHKLTPPGSLVVAGINGCHTTPNSSVAEHSPNSPGYPAKTSVLPNRKTSHIPHVPPYHVAPANVYIADGCPASSNARYDSDPTAASDKNLNCNTEAWLPSKRNVSLGDLSPDPEGYPKS